MAQIKPFIRWAGGKSWLAKQFDTILGETSINRYHEPFLGGGAVFLSLNSKKRLYLSDINTELINAYKTVKESPQEVIQVLEQYEVSESNYYFIRSLNPQCDIEKAARFIYLNQTSYNGLYRVNKQGNYNVPYGFREGMVYDSSRIMYASKKLSNANISHGDFTVNKSKIQERDLVFLDPPYAVSKDNNGFIEYNENLFSLDDQYRLSRFIDYIKEKNGYYVLTNATDMKIREIFDKGDRVIELNRYSLIGGKNAKRKLITELVFTNIMEG